MKLKGQYYTFDDIALVPQFNNIDSRTDPTIDISTWLTKKTRIDIPIVAANMDTVIGEELADLLIRRGSYPIFHRFSNKEELIRISEKYNDGCYMSIGLNEDDELIHEYVGNGVRGFCIDIAHGHDKRMLSLIENLRKSFGDEIEIIAGNVCTEGGYIDLVSAGADAIKVGIGPGAACTTRLVTGFGVPQFSAILECAEAAKKYSVPIIADGGIRGSNDVVKALAAGACSVMMGKIFALTKESAAPKEWISIIDNQLDPNNGIFAYQGSFRDGDSELKEWDGKNEVPFLYCSKCYQQWAKYRGQASEDFQKDYNGGLKNGTVAEGESFWAPTSGSANKVIDKLLAGLRSGLTYGGARTIGELQRKAEYVVVSNGYSDESSTRIL